MADVIKIKKGLDIKMNGQAEKIFVKAPRAKTYAVKPVDFHGLTPKIIPKLCDPVKVGTPIFYDKYNPEVKFTSIPADMKPIRPPTEGCQFFAQAEIDGGTEVMTVSFKDLNGKELFSHRIEPEV